METEKPEHDNTNLAKMLEDCSSLKETGDYTSLKKALDFEKAIKNLSSFQDIHGLLTNCVTDAFKIINQGPFVYKRDFQWDSQREKGNLVTKPPKNFGTWSNTTFFKNGIIKKNDGEIRYEPTWGFVAYPGKHIIHEHDNSITIFYQSIAISRKQFRNGMRSIDPAAALKSFLLRPKSATETIINCGLAMELAYTYGILLFLERLFGDKEGSAMFNQVFSKKESRMCFTSFQNELPKDHFDRLKHPLNALVKYEKHLINDYGFERGRAYAILSQAEDDYFKKHPDGNGNLYNVFCTEDVSLDTDGGTEHVKAFARFGMGDGLVSAQEIMDWLEEAYNQPTTEKGNFPAWPEQDIIEISPTTYFLSLTRILTLFFMMKSSPDLQEEYIKHYYNEVKQCVLEDEVVEGANKFCVTIPRHSSP